MSTRTCWLHTRILLPGRYWISESLLLAWVSEGRMRVRDGEREREREDPPAVAAATAAGPNDWPVRWYQALVMQFISLLRSTSSSTLRSPSHIHPPLCIYHIMIMSDSPGLTIASKKERSPLLWPPPVKSDFCPRASRWESCWMGLRSLCQCVCMDKFCMPASSSSSLSLPTSSCR